MADRSVWKYPDGSTQIEDGNSIAVFDTLLKQAVLAQSERAMGEALSSGDRKRMIALGRGQESFLGFASYMSWAEEAPRAYTVYFWDPCVKELEDTNRVSIMPYDREVYVDPNWRRGLPLTVSFRRPVGASQRTAFVALLRNYLSSVSSVGIGGEGPCEVQRSEITWAGNRAWIELEASRTGQKTLNWLVLSLLQFATQVAITGFAFCMPDLVERRHGRARGVVERNSI